MTELRKTLSGFIHFNGKLRKAHLLLVEGVLQYGKTTKGKAIKKRKKKNTAKDRVRDLDWAKVAIMVGNDRKSAECLRRYNKISGNRGAEKAGALKGPWTEEEDRKVIALVAAHGAKKWSQIAAELPGE